MGKMSDLAIEAELDIQEQQELMDELISTHGETVEIVEKILATFPELVQSSILELSLLDNIPPNTFGCKVLTLPPKIDG